MTQHPLTHVASVVVVGALMSAGAVGAQTVTTTSLNTETPEANGHLGRHDMAADYPGTFRRIVGSIQIVDCARCAR
jgi:hypothetical protein